MLIWSLNISWSTHHVLRVSWKRIDGVGPIRWPRSFDVFNFARCPNVRLDGAVNRLRSGAINWRLGAGGVILSRGGRRYWRRSRVDDRVGAALVLDVGQMTERSRLVSDHLKLTVWHACLVLADRRLAVDLLFLRLFVAVVVVDLVLVVDYLLLCIKKDRQPYQQNIFRSLRLQ